MKKHWRYARYIARHKWFVLVAGLKTGAPLWRLLIHDWSKLMPVEWFAYAERFYGPTHPGMAFTRAWLHHQHRNPHHWQHWVLRRDDGVENAVPMPDKFVKEMVADWMGAGRVITGRWDVGTWYERNVSTIRLHSQTRAAVERLLAEVT